MGTILNYSGSQLQTIRNTVAADTNDLEFNLFMEAAASYQLDPFRRQISAIVFSKNDPKKRKMSIIVNRDGLRAIAQRCGDYRPASGPAQYETDPGLESPSNPRGLISCGVTLYKQDSRGDWFGVYGEAYWDEFAPIKDEWAYNEKEGRRTPTGKKSVDGNWAKMPRVMLQKCAEAQALRAGWPDSFGGIYTEEEMDQAREREPIDVTPAEAVAREQQHRRQNALGNKGVLMIMSDDGMQQRVPMGEVFDRCSAFIRDNDTATVAKWKLQNSEALRDYWADSPSDALELKRV
ncbi:MAG: phage recombination protein Bet, partial [Paracoccaceae bacterium]